MPNPSQNGTPNHSVTSQPSGGQLVRGLSIELAAPHVTALIVWSQTRWLPSYGVLVFVVAYAVSTTRWALEARTMGRAAGKQLLMHSSRLLATVFAASVALLPFMLVGAWRHLLVFPLGPQLGDLAELSQNVQLREWAPFVVTTCAWVLVVGLTVAIHVDYRARRIQSTASSLMRLAAGWFDQARRFIVSFAALTALLFVITQAAMPNNDEHNKSASGDPLTSGPTSTIAPTTQTFDAQDKESLQGSDLTSASTDKPSVEDVPAPSDSSVEETYDNHCGLQVDGGYLAGFIQPGDGFPEQGSPYGRADAQAAFLRVGALAGGCFSEAADCVDGEDGISYCTQFARNAGELSAFLTAHPACTGPGVVLRPYVEEFQVLMSRTGRRVAACTRISSDGDDAQLFPYDGGWSIALRTERGEVVVLDHHVASAWWIGITSGGWAKPTGSAVEAGDGTLTWSFESVRTGNRFTVVEVPEGASVLLDGVEVDLVSVPTEADVRNRALPD